jgi:pyruvate carboxylase
VELLGRAGEEQPVQRAAAVVDEALPLLGVELGDDRLGGPPLEGRKARPALAELDAEQRHGLADDRRATLNELLFPGPTAAFRESRETYGDLSAISTIDYLYGLRRGEEHRVLVREGREMLFGLEAISEPDERGFRNGLAAIDGQLRPVSVRDRSVAADVASSEKAEPGTPGHVAAPYDGAVTVTVAEGDTVEAGQTVATIEAMKMEASITAPVAGTVSRLAVRSTQAVEGGDLVLVIG